MWLFHGFPSLIHLARKALTSLKNFALTRVSGLNSFNLLRDSQYHLVKLRSNSNLYLAMRYSFISNLLWVLLAARCISSFSFLSTSGRKCLGNGKSRDEIACRIFTRQRPLHQFETPSRTQLVLKASTLPLFSSEWQIWSILSVMSTLGIVSEKTNIGSMLSSPIVTMVATLVLSNLGLIPSSSPVYTIVMQKFVPLAIPLLLLDADLRKCIKVTGRLLRAFLVGSVGTVVGTLIAFLLVPMKNIAGADKIASALCARHVSLFIF